MTDTESPNDGIESPYLPLMVLGVPGRWKTKEALIDVIRAADPAWESTEAGFEHPDLGEFQLDIVPADVRMEQAFKASADRIRPSLTEDDYLAIRKHLCTAYVLSGNYGRDDAAEQAQRMMYAAHVLLEAGGIAVKCESSGIAHSKARWTELVARMSEAAGRPGDEAEDRYALYRPLYEAFVRSPIGDDDDLFTCGMHLLGRPDAIVRLADVGERGEWGAVGLMEALHLYQLCECDYDTLQDGNTFSPAADWPKMKLRRQPDGRYPDDDLFWNRWGLLRLAP